MKTLEENLKPLSMYLKFLHTTLSGKEKQPPKDLQEVSMEKKPMVFVGPRPAYSVYALPELNFIYSGEGISATGKMKVNRFWTDGNVWRQKVLCKLTRRTFLGILNILNNKSISLSSPGFPNTSRVKTKVSAPMGRTLGLDVHQTLKLPVAGWLAFQINGGKAVLPVHSGGNRLRTVPWAWANVTVESLPYNAYNHLRKGAYIYLFSQILLIVIFSCELFVILLRVIRHFSPLPEMSESDLASPFLRKGSVWPSKEPV